MEWHLHKPKNTLWLSNTLRTIISILSFLIFSGFLKAQNPPPAQWVEQLGDADEEYAFGIAADDSSNTFVIGLIGPGDTAFRNKSQCVNHDIFVARYNSQGQAQWLTKVGAMGTDIGWGIAIDKDHDICTVSCFQDELYLNNDTVISRGFFDILLMKYNAQGTLLWAKSAGGVLDDEGYSIATDSQGNIYITGSFVDTAYFDTVSLISRGYRDVFLAKYDALGNLVWAINAGGSAADEDEGYALTIDASDNIYLTGKFGATAIFSADTLTTRGYTDIFTAQYNTSGVLQWIRQSGGAGIDRGQGVHTDGAGSLLVTGYFGQSAIFGADTLVSNGGSDMFISKYSAQGVPSWTRNAGGSGNDEGASVTVAANKKIYVAGYFADTAAFGTHLLTSWGYYDAFLSCLDSSGNFEWIKQGGGPGVDAAGAVCADTSSSIYLAGLFDYTCSFDSVTATSIYDQNFFVAKIATNNINVVKENTDDRTNLIVFPNPSEGPISLQWKGNTVRVLHVKIINAVGELVLEKELDTALDENKIDLRNFKKGIYFLQVSARGAVSRQKIIIE